MELKLKQLIEKTDFEKLFQKKGYAFFVNGNYNVNIIGVRNLLGDNIQRDTFNDALILIFKENGKWVKLFWDATTDPSLKFLKSPSNSSGTAILVPGQYRGVYKVDLHGGKYTALCQRNGNVNVYRDKNKDNKLDMDPSTIKSGMFGINIHRASATSVNETIGSYSAGCQVFKSYRNFNEFMSYIQKSKSLFGNSFTYTLITTDDLK